ncbi:hypothetical protein vseg_004885 [Gypsophila vaccaria]
MAPNPPWEDLQEELLSNISAFLTLNPLDILAFREVCKSWRSSIPTPPTSLRKRTLWNQTHNPPECCILSVTVVYSLRPPSQDPRSVSNTWMCFADQLETEKLSIRQHFHTHSYDCYCRPTYFPRTLHLLDFNASELGRFFNLRTKEHGMEVDKVVLSSNMSAAVTLSSEGKIGLIRLGSGKLQSTNDWEIIHDGKGFQFDDIVDFKGVMLGVDRRGSVYEIKLDKRVTINAIVPSFPAGGSRRKRLVESLGELFLVLKCDRLEKTDKKSVAFEVYQLLLDTNKNKWVRVTEISDRMFFFDPAFSFSASHQQLLGRSTKGCIIFKVNGFQDYSVVDDNYQGSRYIGVWHMEDADKVDRIESCPVYPRLLCPPPTWNYPSRTLVHDQ